MGFVDSVYDEGGNVIQEVFPHTKVDIVIGVSLNKEDYVLHGISLFFIFVYIYIKQ